MTIMPNILTQRFSTPYNSVPFPQIREEHYLPAFEELIAQAEQEINQITENPESPTFENTIEALEVVSSTFFNINSAETNDEIQNIAQKVSPMLTEFSSKISQNEALFERIKTVFDQKNQYTLNPEQQMLLNETYKGFVRSGALLNESDKKKLEKLNMELAVKSLQFGQNVLAATNNYFLHITDKQKLKGI